MRCRASSEVRTGFGSIDPQVSGASGCRLCHTDVQIGTAFGWESIAIRNSIVIRIIAGGLRVPTFSRALFCRRTKGTRSGSHDWRAAPAGIDAMFTLPFVAASAHLKFDRL